MRPSQTVKLLVLIAILAVALAFLIVKERRATQPGPTPVVPPAQPGFNYIKPHITDIYCDAEKTCPQGLECWDLEDQFVTCVDPDPCLWYCGKVGCVVMESYPPQLRCD